MATIQIKRAALATAVPMPVIGLDGEMAYARGGYTNAPAHTAGDDLIISYGGANHALIGRTRQVELTGAQTITGRKTFGLPALSILGGVANDVLATDGAGNLVWTPVNLDQATQTVFGGTYIADDPKIKAGTDDITTISPRGLRTQLGADTVSLVTNAKTVVPAINEMYNLVEQLSGIIIFAGIYDAATSTGTYNGQGGIAAGTGPLPPADATNGGSYVIVTVEGPGGVGNEPVGPIYIEDWLLSDGNSWEKLNFSQAATVAINVAIVPDIGLGANVHVALEQLNADKLNLSGGTMTGPLNFSGRAGVIEAIDVGEQLILRAGGSNDNANIGGNVLIEAGTHGDTEIGGSLLFDAGGSANGRGGIARITAGTGPLSGGSVQLYGGGSQVFNPISRGGSIELTGGNGAIPGDIVLSPGDAETNAPSGLIQLRKLPRVAQTDADAVWNNNGILNIGAGGTGGGGGLDQATADGLYVNVIGDTMTGDLNILKADALFTTESTDGESNIFISSNANGSNNLRGLRNGVQRWIMEIGNGAPESGGNAGSIFNLMYWDDLNTTAKTALQINRIDGALRAQGNDNGDSLISSYGIRFLEEVGFQSWVARTTGTTLWFSASDLGGNLIGGKWLTIDSVNGVTLLRHPANPFEAATKQYVDTEIEQVLGIIVFAGIYDAATSTGTYNGLGGIAQGTGPLPLADATNQGSYLIVTVGGPGGIGNEPIGPIEARDWLVSDGTVWELLPFSQPNIIASDVTIFPDIGLGPNVHVALESVLPLAGGTMTGPITLTSAADILGIGAISILAGDTASGQGGRLEAIAGDAAGVGEKGGLALLQAGNGASGGDLQIKAGIGSASVGGKISILGGDGSGVGGDVLIQAGKSTASANAGNIQLIALPSTTGIGSGGDVRITTGNSVNGAAGSFEVTLGQTSGTGTSGLLKVVFLPTVTQTDPDAIWNNNGVLNIGAGGVSGGGAIVTDGVSIDGDGTAGDPIMLLNADGGTF